MNCFRSLFQARPFVPAFRLPFLAVLNVAVLNIVVLNAYFAFVACGREPPRERPRDFSLQYSFSPGVLPYSESIRIKGDRVVYRIITHGRKIEARFQRSAPELDRLYNQLLRLRVFHIVSKKRTRASSGISARTSLEFTLAGRFYRIRNGGQWEVPPSRRRDYNRAVSAALQTAKRPPRGEIVFFALYLDRASLDSLGPKFSAEADLGRAYLYAPYNSAALGIIAFDEKKSYPIRVQTRNPALNMSFILHPDKHGGGLLAVDRGKLIFKPLAKQKKKNP